MNESINNPSTRSCPSIRQFSKWMNGFEGDVLPFLLGGSNLCKIGDLHTINGWMPKVIKH
jgi:hypothetical protein